MKKIRKNFVRIKQLFQFVSGYEQVEMVPRTEREKQIIRNKILMGCLACVIIGLIIYFLHSFIKDNQDNLKLFKDNVGIILTSIVTILTTYFIVHQNKKVDYHKERLEHLPILDLTIYKSINKEEINNIIILEEGNDYHSIFRVINIGKGIAFNVEAYGLDDESEALGYDIPKASLETIIVNGYKIIQLNCNCDDYNYFTLRFNYKDLFENQYNQDFIIKYNDDGAIEKIETKAPQLVRRTRRFRYIQ